MTGLPNLTFLKDLIKTDEAILQDELTKHLRRYIHITYDNKAIQCSQ